MKKIKANEADFTGRLKRKGEGIFSKQVSFHPLPAPEVRRGSEHCCSRRRERTGVPPAAQTHQRKAASHFTSQIQPALFVFIRKHLGHLQNPTIVGRKGFKSE